MGQKASLLPRQTLNALEAQLKPSDSTGCPSSRSIWLDTHAEYSEKFSKGSKATVKQHLAEVCDRDAQYLLSSFILKRINVIAISSIVKLKD